MRFSIITCTYNSAEYLQKNIDSVKNQTFQDFEHIFIDGFSKDSTTEIIKKYQEEFPDKVKLFQSHPRGISNAMNIGIKKSFGKYLTHLHSDDSFFNNNILEKTNAFLEINHDPDWIYGKINIIDENNKFVGTFPRNKVFRFGKCFFSNHLLKFFNFIPHQAVFIKKEIFDKFGFFDETISSAMDFDLWIRIKNKTNWIFFNETVSNYKISRSAQSSGKNNQEKNKRDLKIVQKKNLNYLELFLSNIANKFIEKINTTTR